jgi:hypothetical protein
MNERLPDPIDVRYQATTSGQSRMRQELLSKHRVDERELWRDRLVVRPFPVELHEGRIGT